MALLRRKAQAVQEVVVNKSKTRVLIVAVLLVLFSLGGVSYYGSSTYLMVSFENVQKVDAYEISKPGSLASSVTKSGDSLKLRRGGYSLHAYGANGYADTYRTVTMTERHQTLDLKPYYSQAHLDALLINDTAAIKSALAVQFDNLSQYQVQPGSLYHLGEWYGTSLKYVGSDIFNADTLHVVLQKSNGQWRVMTTDPSISLSELTYPSIPKDILESVNKL